MQSINAAQTAIVKMDKQLQGVTARRSRHATGRWPGHIVVRVDRGGDRYRVFVVDNRDERDTVVAVRGPFNSASAQ
jgi:hypothetical protein